LLLAREAYLRRVVASSHRFFIENEGSTENLSVVYSHLKTSTQLTVGADDERGFMVSPFASRLNTWMEKTYHELGADLKNIAFRIGGSKPILNHKF
jgi:hypothetical protein